MSHFTDNLLVFGRLLRAVGLDVHAGAQQHALDLPHALRRDEALALGHQHARAAHLAQHLAAADGVDPERRARHRGRSGRELGQRQAGDREHGDAAGDVEDAATAELLGAFGAGDVHRATLL